MAETGITLDNPRAPIEKVGSADILVAIPTYNDAETIAPLVKAALGASRRFSDQKCVVAQVDGGSTDGTVERTLDAAGADAPFMQMTYPIYPVHRLSLSDQGTPGRDSAYHTILALAQDLGVRACCIVEPDIPSATPDWISALVQPILEYEYDFVAPYYQRHKYEGLLVNGILYPAVRALFGKRLRHPVGRDFGLSGAFIRHCLSSESWNRELIRGEVDVWMNIQAVSVDMKVCQARLGVRPRVRKEGAPDLSSVLAHIAGTLYSNVEQTVEFWQRIRGSQPVPTFGLSFDAAPDVPQVDATGMIEAFQVGYENLREIWGTVLPPAALLEIKKASRQSIAAFAITDEFWARTVYDFAVAHHLGSISRDHLLRALTPLYMGWAASFIQSVKDVSSSQAEERIERLSLMFEKQKPYLISRWRWPDRFMP